MTWQVTAAKRELRLKADAKDVAGHSRASTCAHIILRACADWPPLSISLSRAKQRSRGEPARQPRRRATMAGPCVRVCLPTQQSSPSHRVSRSRAALALSPSHAAL